MNHHVHACTLMLAHTSKVAPLGGAYRPMNTIAAIVVGCMGYGSGYLWIWPSSVSNRDWRIVKPGG